MLFAAIAPRASAGVGVALPNCCVRLTRLFLLFRGVWLRVRWRVRRNLKPLYLSSLQVLELVQAGASCKGGLCCHGWVLLVLNCHGRGYEYLHSALVGDASNSFGLDEWCSRAGRLVVAEEPFAKCFWGFASFEVFVNVRFKPSDKNGIPDLVKDYIFYTVVHYGKDSPWSTKCGGAEELFNRFFQHVWESRQSVCDLQRDFIGDHLLAVSWRSGHLHPLERVQVPLAAIQISESSESCHCSCQRSGSFHRRL